MLRIRSLVTYSLLIGLSVFIAACASDTRTLGLIYERSAQYHKPDRNPIIVIPGVLGSRLVEDATNRTVWGAFNGGAANPNDPDDAQLLALPIGPQEQFIEGAGNRVRSDGVLDQIRLRIAGISFGIRAYVGILSTLGVGGYSDESIGLNGVDYGDDHFTCFQFDYDWRLDNVENAARLKIFIEEKRAFIQEEYKKRYGLEDAEVKFDIVAHSMGGLITRYFMRYGDADLPTDGSLPELTWEGSEYVERAILVGTPNAGSSQAFDQLLNGFDPAKPILPHYPASILGTYPSIYQLLPRPRHAKVVMDNEAETPITNIYDGELWEKYEWGLAAQTEETQTFLEHSLPYLSDPEARREVALDFQTKVLKRAETFHKALDLDAPLPEGGDLYLVAGDIENTPDRVAVNQETGEVRFIDTVPGDGSVARYSALLDERVGQEWQPTLRSPIHWTEVQFIPSDHIGLTSDPSFSNNVLYLLLEDPRD